MRPRADPGPLLRGHLAAGVPGGQPVRRPLPYYREEDVLARTGFVLHRSTQWRWMRGLAELLQPLVDLMRRRTRLSQVLGIDETPCPLICPELDRTRSAYLYTQYGDAAHPYDCYYFASHKTRENIQAILGDYRATCSRTHALGR
ncbi:MAG TPA: transposase [Pirellulaceae bacterium]|nr:transposase [Pirellulaceae bacterium]